MKEPVGDLTTLCAWSTSTLCQELKPNVLLVEFLQEFLLILVSRHPWIFCFLCVTDNHEWDEPQFDAFGPVEFFVGRKIRKRHHHSACVPAPCLSGSLKGKVRTKREKLGHYLPPSPSPLPAKTVKFRTRCNTFLELRGQGGVAWSAWGLVLERKQCSFSGSIQVPRSARTFPHWCKKMLLAPS